MKEKMVVYEPDNSIKKGYVLIFREIYREIIDNRWLTYQLFKRDFFATYKQSFFGIFWAILLPIISVGTFIALSRAGIFSIGEIQIPYPIYAILGMAFWQIFSTGIIGSSGALVKAGSMITQINFSKKSLLFASAGQSIVSFIIQFLLVCLLFVFYGIAPSWAILLVPIMVIPIILLTLGLGMFMSLLNGIMRDVGNVMSLLMTFLMFLTPILYVKPSKGILMEITEFNPLYYLISESRNLILSGNILEANGFAISAGVSVMIFIISLVGFHLAETRISERV
jgi:lipopolysaccharide transport system permease protein